MRETQVDRLPIAEGMAARVVSAAGAEAAATGRSAAVAASAVVVVRQALTSRALETEGLAAVEQGAWVTKAMVVR
jgi:hypothetical protein